MRVVFGAITVVLLSVIAYFLCVGTVGGDGKKPPTSLDQLSDFVPGPRLPEKPIVVAPPAEPALAPVPPRVFAAPAPIPVPPVAEAVGKRTHTVQAGESLWTISKTYYGSGDYHARIADANRLKNNIIRAGQVLVIPAAPAGSLAGAVRHVTPPPAEVRVESVAEVSTETAAEPASEAGNDAAAEIVDVSGNDETKSASSTPGQMAPTLSVRVPLGK